MTIGTVVLGWTLALLVVAHCGTLVPERVLGEEWTAFAVGRALEVKLHIEFLVNIGLLLDPEAEHVLEMFVFLVGEG